jgi:hypothetical protein
MAQITAPNTLVVLSYVSSYVPAGHGVHSGSEVSDLKLPGGQRVHMSPCGG